MPGLGGDRDWPTSAAWADLDADGDLDLYVCHYLVFDAQSQTACPTPNPGRSILQSRDFARFRTMSSAMTAAGSSMSPPTAGFVDLAGAGWAWSPPTSTTTIVIDLYVANDMSANYLFRNLGGFRFEERAFAAGAAGNSSGSFQSGMGIACGDLDGDGRPDLAVTNYYGESTTLFRNLGGGLFADAAAPSGSGRAHTQLAGLRDRIPRRQ